MTPKGSSHPPHMNGPTHPPTHLLLEDDDGVGLAPGPALLLLAAALVLGVGGGVAREAVGVDLVREGGAEGGERFPSQTNN